jgi:hypothetical protein
MFFAGRMKSCTKPLRVIHTLALEEALSLWRIKPLDLSAAWVRFTTWITAFLS